MSEHLVQTPCLNAVSELPASFGNTDGEQLRPEAAKLRVSTKCSLEAAERGAKLWSLDLSKQAWTPKKSSGMYSWKLSYIFLAYFYLKNLVASAILWPQIQTQVQFLKDLQAALAGKHWSLQSSSIGKTSFIIKSVSIPTFDQVRPSMQCFCYLSDASNSKFAQSQKISGLPKNIYQQNQKILYELVSIFLVLWYVMKNLSKNWSHYWKKDG